jgi:hypothetical protein
MASSLHAELCRRAERWLKTVGCGVTATELVTFAHEQPDVIGWRQGRSVVCEVKVSRADFAADLAKPWRRDPAQGMGDWRIYVAPAGLLLPAEIPCGWGLLEWDGRLMHRTHNVPLGNIWGEPPLQGDKHKEALVLCSLVRRLQKPRTDRRDGYARSG